MVIMHVWFIGLRGHHGEIAGKHMVRPLFLLLEFFCLVEILGKGFGVWFSGSCGLGGLGILGLLLILLTSVLRFSMLEGWLTHGDLALDTGVDFLAVAEHRLIPARVRSEWSRA